MPAKRKRIPGDGWQPPPDLDPQCLALCLAINSIPGIYTYCSCCGHGRDHFRIWFHATRLSALPDLLYWFDNCHSGKSGWTVQVRTDCGRQPAFFMVEGPVGAFSDADDIAALILEDQGITVSPNANARTPRDGSALTPKKGG